MSTQPAERGIPRAVVVDDSSFMGTVIADPLRKEGIDVVVEAPDGGTAIGELTNAIVGTISEGAT
ncbi:response regulator [Halalkalicoccus subterraneus]|uniref:hypothetical protein n=1 Tax=Halalkalicoccus subterraneus TaxID=2675002 RepID=UPI0013CE8AB4|nr:hypothetical protein [Halalkalicoccus subterraneus]